MSELKLVLRNTGNVMLIDPKDWQNVRDVWWLEQDGRVVSKSGVLYEDHIGKSGLWNKKGNIYDKRHSEMCKVGFKAVFNSYENREELVPVKLKTVASKRKKSASEVKFERSIMSSTLSGGCLVTEIV